MGKLNLTQTDHSVDRDVLLEKPPPRLQLERGASVGRYVILDLVGEGGMGVVYAAYDPELDRKLALKLLRTASRDRRAERRRLRLIREAQAMARLSHANVITVHDVGTIDDQVFVAMEFIEGCSLAEWIRRGHDWRHVVDVFVQAGEGLAAAHAAGLVHRDFKPDNVMLTGEHRAVVTDFGLARASGRQDASQSRDPESLGEVPRPSLSTTVTAAGAIMGTPAYMSPEQHEGREVDARSDQFAFAVALYESLYGQRPFPGDDVASLAYNVGAGNIRPAPSRSSVPSWLRQVLLRALSIDSANRYPSMVELLDALRRDPSGRRMPWWTVAAVAGGLAGVAALASAALDADPPPCESGAEQAEAALSGDVRTQAQDAFVEAPAPYAAAGWPAVDAAVTAYASAWSASYAEVCEATHARGEQSQAQLDARMACLDRRLEEGAAVLALLAEGDPTALERGLDAMNALPHPAGCERARVEAFSLDVSVADEVDALRPQLARVAALDRTGLHASGLDAARELLEQALTLDAPAVHAEARLRLASLQHAAKHDELAEFNYKEALARALESAADDVATEAAVALVGIIGQDPARVREAEGWAGVAAAMLSRTAAPAKERAALLGRRASLLETSGRLAAARRPLREAATLLEDTYGEGDVRVAEAWAALGRYALRAGAPEDAAPLLTRAMDVVQSELGAKHPRTAALMHLLGEVALVDGDVDASRQLFEAALAVRRLQADPVPQAETMLLLSRAEIAAGRLEAADQTLRSVTALGELPAAVLGQAVVAHARLLLRRGDAVAAMRRAEEARPALDDTGALAQRWALDAVIADALLQQGRTERAQQLLDGTIAALEGRHGDATPALAEPLTIRGELLLARDQPARALGALERALSLRSPVDPQGLARTEFALARALVRVDARSARALALAEQAQERLSPQERLYDHVERWLAGRGAG
ncbi:MAG: protein kinase [Myxococcota bacterium]